MTSKRADFERIYKDCAGKVMALAMRLAGDRVAAEDLVSETFLRALHHLQSVAGPDQDGVLPWLCRVCINVHRDQRRRERIRRVYRAELTSRVVIRSHCSSDHDRSGSHEVLIRRMEELPTDERHCILLRIQGYSYEEIGVLMRLDKKGVKNAVQNAVRHLKEGTAH